MPLAEGFNVNAWSIQLYLHDGCLYCIRKIMKALYLFLRFYSLLRPSYELARSIRGYYFTLCTLYTLYTSVIEIPLFSARKTAPASFLLSFIILEAEMSLRRFGTSRLLRVSTFLPCFTQFIFYFVLFYMNGYVHQSRIFTDSSS